jgi:hypothetical protein
LLWYIVAVFLIGPLVAAPFTGGGSLGLYLAPFMLLTGDTDKAPLVILAAWLLPALLLWSVHLFIRMTIRYQMRRVHTAQLYRRTH